MREALTHFHRITRVSAKNAARKDVINSARLTLGYFYFELTNYRRALEFLTDIPHDFYDYPEALLTKGWSQLKMGDYKTALLTMRELVNDYPDHHNQQEASFVMGQCFLKLGYYDFGIEQFNKIVSGTSVTTQRDSLMDNTRVELAAQEKQLAQLRAELEDLETKLLGILPPQAGSGILEDILADRAQIQQKRRFQIEQIFNERQNFEALSSSITKLKREIEKSALQKNWRAYAEYGKSRALYLKGMGIE